MNVHSLDLLSTTATLQDACVSSLTLLKISCSTIVFNLNATPKNDTLCMTQHSCSSSSFQTEPILNFSGFSSFRISFVFLSFQDHHYISLHFSTFPLFIPLPHQFLSFSDSVR